MKTPRSDDGFTLLEVLVAFAILAVALGVLYQSLFASRAGLNKVEEQSIALNLATSTLARVGTDIPLRVGTYEGLFELPGYAYEVTIRTADFEREGSHSRELTKAHEVGVAVFRTRAPAHRSELATILVGASS